MPAAARAPAGGGGRPPGGSPSVQLPSGMVPWFPGATPTRGTTSRPRWPWPLAGDGREAERAFEWLAATSCRTGVVPLLPGRRRRGAPPGPQRVRLRGDRGWWRSSWQGTAESWRRCGRWSTGPLAWCLRRQRPGGEIAVVGGPRRRPRPFRPADRDLVASTQSLRCAARIAGALGRDGRDWELAAGRVGPGGGERPGGVRAQGPLGHGLVLPGAERRVVRATPPGAWSTRWDEFVMRRARRALRGRQDLGHGGRDGGVRHGPRRRRPASTRPSSCWAGPATCVHDDGGYWTGCVHPQCVRFPGGERSTYSGAAVLIADHVLHRRSPAAAVFAQAASGTSAVLVQAGPGRGPPGQAAGSRRDRTALTTSAPA